MLNKAILNGRLTKAPELKQTNSGKDVCSFTIAVDRIEVRSYEDKDGNKRTATEIIAEEVLFGGSKNTTNASEKPAEVKTDQFEQIEDENDLPFN